MEAAVYKQTAHKETTQQPQYHKTFDGLMTPQDNQNTDIDNLMTLTTIADKKSTDKKKSKEKSASQNSQDRTKEFDEKFGKPAEEKLKTEIKLPFQILGFNAERKILAWYKGTLIFFSVSQLRIDELALFVDKLSDENKEEYKNKIIEEARGKGIIDETEPIKMGVWFINGKWLIVSGKNALEISEGKINEINYPVYEGKIIQFGKPWLNVKKFKDKFGKITLAAVYDKIYTYISQWCWKEKDAAKYLAAFIMIIAFQHALKWRPWLYLSGETGTGKSLFLDEVLELLFSNLIKRADKTTEHAIYQAVGNTSRILCLDEFEKSKHIPQVMEALKLMSRGGEKNSGTPGEKELSYLVHHLPVLASIYTPATCLKDESQRNRIVQFELVKPKDRTPPSVWRAEEAEEILTDLISAVIGSWDDIQEKANCLIGKTSEIKKDMDGKIDDRTVQNFMYASAILEIATGKEYTVPTWAKAEKKSDGQSIVETIIFSKIRHENSDYLVHDLIDAALRRPGNNELAADKAKNALRLHGLTVVERNGWFLAIHTQNAMKHLFKGSDEFKSLDITLPLERITGSEKKAACFGGSSSLRSIQIPMGEIDELRGLIERPQ